MFLIIHVYNLNIYGYMGSIIFMIITLNQNKHIGRICLAIVNPPRDLVNTLDYSLELTNLMVMFPHSVILLVK